MIQKKGTASDLLALFGKHAQVSRHDEVPVE